MSQTTLLYLLAALATLMILPAHEYAHAAVADKLGDHTARNLGRLTLNPLKHLDPLGALCMVIFHFGWAKPVPINARYFQRPKRDFALVAAAGPLCNLILAFFGAMLYEVTWLSLQNVAFESAFLYNVAVYSLTFLYLYHQINLGFAVFNLIPIPPLDGSRLLNVFLPEKAYFGWMRYEKYFYYAILIWLFAGRYLARLILALSFPGADVLAKILSLSELLGTVTTWISDGMLAFWEFVFRLIF